MVLLLNDLDFEFACFGIGEFKIACSLAVRSEVVLLFSSALSRNRFDATVLREIVNRVE